MTEEQTFLSAIFANPDDHTAKLVYADWLEEHDDPRAEYVRLKVRAAAAEGPERADVLQQLEAIEPTVPAAWVVRLDGPVWCVAGNIVHSRPYGPGGEETRHGTRLFKPKAKVYLAGEWGVHRLFHNPLSERDQIRVVGRHRKSMKWIGCILRVDRITNWRIDLVYQPGILVRLKKEGWTGFHLKRGEFVCPEDKSSPEAVRRLLELLRGRPVV